MKVRAGFVSNSSSASFIIKWKHKRNKEMTLKEALDVMEHEYMFEDGMTRTGIEKLTEDIGDGKFKTEFFTSMMNSADNFGEIAKSFLINIFTSDDFEIFDYRIDKD